jgi:transcriptional regulator with XRE-family HTH domain
MSEHLARRIMQLRRARKWTKRDLATYAGVGKATITRIERGEGVNSDTLEKIFAVFGRMLWDKIIE